MVAPQAEIAAAITDNGRVGVLATTNTVESGAYRRALEAEGRAPRRDRGGGAAPRAVHPGGLALRRGDDGDGPRLLRAAARGRHRHPDPRLHPLPAGGADAAADPRPQRAAGERRPRGRGGDPAHPRARPASPARATTRAPTSSSAPARSPRSATSPPASSRCPSARSARSSSPFRPSSGTQKFPFRAPPARIFSPGSVPCSTGQPKPRPTLSDVAKVEINTPRRSARSDRRRRRARRRDPRGVPARDRRGRGRPERTARSAQGTRRDARRLRCRLGGKRGRAASERCATTRRRADAGNDRR